MDTLLEIEAIEFAGTALGALTVAVRTKLLVGSRTYPVPAGAMVFPLYDLAPRASMVLSGTARSFLTGADGRQLTIRYARRGAIVGKRSELIGAHAPVAVQAVTDCVILEFDRDLLMLTAASDVSVANAIIVDLTKRLEDIYAATADTAFGSVQQRVVRHLLALAEYGLVDGNRCVRVSQQQLADATASSREVVARVLADLRAANLISTAPREITLHDVDGLVPLLTDWQRVSPY
ncbi:MAG: Crp/Fnr family transcriptional regulator [Chloroflexota bacterium]